MKKLLIIAFICLLACACNNSNTDSGSSMTVPAAPSNLHGFYRGYFQCIGFQDWRLVYSCLKITWNDNSDNETGFILEYYNKSLNKWTDKIYNMAVNSEDRIKPTINPIAASTTSFTGQLYFDPSNVQWRIKAFNNLGESQYSIPAYCNNLIAGYSAEFPANNYRVHINVPNTDNKYHTDDCGRLFVGKAIYILDAEAMGYNPCPLCFYNK